MIADLLLADSTNVNQRLVKEGWCWWYQKYAPNALALEQSQQEAKKAKRGLWSDPIQSRLGCKASILAPTRSLTLFLFSSLCTTHCYLGLANACDFASAMHLFPLILRRYYNLRMEGLWFKRILFTVRRVPIPAFIERMVLNVVQISSYRTHAYRVSDGGSCHTDHG